MKINKKELLRIIKESIYSALTGNSETNGTDGIKIVEYIKSANNWSYIVENLNKIWDFLDGGYKYAGYDKFCGCDNKRSLLKNANLIKIAFIDDIIIAISVYTGYAGGFKNVGITATTDTKLRGVGVDAVKKIIKTDISNFDLYFWAECSGSVEYLYNKYNGIKIPNSYASSILGKDVVPDDDGYHYMRTIKGMEQRKIIYGFNTEEIFNKVRSEMEAYIDRHINKILSMRIDESIEAPSFGRLSSMEASIAVVNVFVDERWEEWGYDFPEASLKKLRKHVSVLQEIFSKGQYPENKKDILLQAIDNGAEILNTSSPMEFFKF